MTKELLVASGPVTTEAIAPAIAKVSLPLIVCGGGLTGLGVSRILGERGVRPWSIGNGDSIYRHSRYHRLMPSLSGDIGPDGIEEFLTSGSVSESVLMPCADDWLLAIGSLPQRLQERFLTSMPPLHVLETLVDKWKFAQLVRDRGVPHPDTRCVHSIEELRNIPEEDLQGRLLKPIHSLEFSRKHGVKALLIQDKASVLVQAEAVQFPILLQRYIAGPATSHYFLDGFIDRHGKVCALFARRRLRMYPAKLSNSTLMISIPVASMGTAADSLLAMLRHLKYRGIFSAEFKYDEQDGQFQILEVNARPWWYVEFAARCGVDVCTMAYRDALSLEVEPVMSYRVGRRYTYLSMDFAGFMHHSEGFPASFWSWFMSIAGAYDAIFRWSDPAPALVHSLDLMRGRWWKK